MEPTISEDIGLVRIRLTQDVQHGDIVVYRHYNYLGANSNRIGRFDYHMKRVIALGGDVLAFKLFGYVPQYNFLTSTNDVFLNGELLDESGFVHPSTPFEGNYFLQYTYQDAGFEFIDGKLTLTIPQGYFFSMGDNRRWSRDGRYYGATPKANLVGVWVQD